MAAGFALVCRSSLFLLRNESRHIPFTESLASFWLVSVNSWSCDPFWQGLPKNPTTPHIGERLPALPTPRTASRPAQKIPINRYDRLGRFFLRQSDSLNEEPKSNPSGPPVPIGWLKLFSPCKEQAKKPLTATMQRNFTTGEKKPRDFSFNYN